MRKKIRIISSLVFLMIICFCSSCFAANGYDFEVNYTGDIIANQEKAAEVVLVGDGSGTGYSKVRIKIDIAGPSTPKILATDTSLVEHDIAQLGYWGPEEGFAIPDTVRNVTPVKATFDQPGEYKITLSLINKEAADAVITSKEVTMVVKEDTPPANETTNQVNEVVENEIVTNEITNGVIDELPKTGASVTELILYTIAIVGIIMFAIYRIRYQNN